MTGIEQAEQLPTADLAVLVARSEAEGLRFVRRLADEWAAGTNQFAGPGEAFFVARLGGQLVGVCGLNIDPYAGDDRVGRVRRLYVHPSHRRAGIGRRLVEAVIRATVRFDRLRVRTYSPAAAAFYERLGFRPTPCDSHATHELAIVGDDP